MEGKVALITGAGRGQGRSHAVRLAEEGADIIAVDICENIDTVGPLSTPEDLAETVRLVQALDRRIVATQADVRDLDQMTEAVDAGVAELGRLDIVAANAGIGALGMAVEFTEEQWQDTIDVDLSGVWHTTRAAIPHMIEGGRGGSIVITSSTAGVFAYPFMAGYNAAKHAVIGLAGSMALELAPHMIRVNAVLPTTVNSPLIRSEQIDEPTRDDMAKWNALPIPWVEPVDVSNAIVFLSSDEARYITGISLPVDAGLLAKSGTIEPIEPIFSFFGQAMQAMADMPKGGAAS